MQSNIDEIVQHFMERQYNNLNKNLDALQKKKYSHNKYSNSKTKQV
jgi:hypothetical protein